MIEDVFLLIVFMLPLVAVLMIAAAVSDYLFSKRFRDD